MRRTWVKKKQLHCLYKRLYGLHFIIIRCLILCQIDKTTVTNNFDILLRKAFQGLATFYISLHRKLALGSQERADESKRQMPSSIHKSITSCELNEV